MSRKTKTCLDGRIIDTSKSENKKLLQTTDVTKYGYKFEQKAKYFLKIDLQSFRLGVCIRTRITQEVFTFMWSFKGQPGKPVGRVARFQENPNPTKT